MPKGMLSACFPPGIYLLGCGFLVLCLQLFFALFIGEADDFATIFCCGTLSIMDTAQTYVLISDQVVSLAGGFICTQ
jgi:hypothetical protein